MSHRPVPTLRLGLCAFVPFFTCNGDRLVELDILKKNIVPFPFQEFQLYDPVAIAGKKWDVNIQTQS